MKKQQLITTLFLDIGGVLLTNGWDRQSRELASQVFHLDFNEIEQKHQLLVDVFELGEISLKEYLKSVIFYKSRSFTMAQFQKFIFSQSKRLPDTVECILKLKKQYGLKVVAVNNESREINNYRIQKFKLARLIDFFVSSCYIHLKKPDIGIFKTALEMSQSKISEVIYVDDRKPCVKIAETIGISAIHHQDGKSTYSKLLRALDK